MTHHKNYPLATILALTAFTGWTFGDVGLKLAREAHVPQLDYSQVITGALFGYLIWGDRPDAYLFASAAVIVLSGLYLVRHERRISRVMVRAQ